MKITPRLLPPIHRVAIAALFVALSSPAFADQDFTPTQGDQPHQPLELNLSQGMVFTQTMQQQTTVGQQVMGQQMQMQQEMTGVLVNEVEQVDDAGRATIAATFHRAALKIDAGPGAALEHDTAADNDPNNPLAMLDGLVGQRITYSIDPQGRVGDVEGIDAMLEAMLEAGGDVPPAQRQQVMDMLGEHYGEEAFIEQLTHQRIYPQQPVGQGARWRQQMTVAQPTEMALDRRFTLQERGDDAAVLELEGTLELAEDAEPIDTGQALIQLELSGEEEGRIELDATTGLINRLESRTTIQGPLNVQMQNAEAPPIEGEMSITTQNTITTTEGRPD